MMAEVKFPSHKCDVWNPAAAEADTGEPVNATPVKVYEDRIVTIQEKVNEEKIKMGIDLSYSLGDFTFPGDMTDIDPQGNIVTWPKDEGRSASNTVIWSPLGKIIPVPSFGLRKGECAEEPNPPQALIDEYGLG